MLVGALWLWVAVTESMAQPSAGGIVYGPKGAFNINAPKGWVLDPSAGACRASAASLVVTMPPSPVTMFLVT